MQSVHGQASAANTPGDLIPRLTQAIQGEVGHGASGAHPATLEFNVIDYKSGRRASLKPEQLATGQQLQLPLYVEAAQALVFHKNAEPLQAGYWGMASGLIPSTTALT